ncbi:MAG: (Fe-S)-binding protein, partial [Desulfobacteraceae bacterium]|nr:(Fe-S)-binding protein [Actinomycetota bacterium]MBU4258928.1 (Fe-S)-binding protein [Pseudomonadota bacterium]MCG2830290.1 (Fe-S)-binding protein [Desulfobacteraceae bacterium]
MKPTIAKREPVEDAALDNQVAKLTPEQIERVVNGVLNNETAGRMWTYVNTCIHCGLCAEACQWYLSNDRDVSYAPVTKIKDTIWPMLKNKGKVSAEFIKRCAEIAYTECNVCRRCGMYCPFGVDIAYMLLIVRRICAKLEMVPLYLQDTVHSHAATMNQMWVKPDEWIDTLQWQEEDGQSYVPSARLPLEKEGAEIMYSVIGPEPKFLAQLLGNITVIMAVAGLDWTMPAFAGWDNSNMPMFSGDFEIMARVERLHHETAQRLKVKKIVMGECGHAFRGAEYDGPTWMGWLRPPIPIVHAIDFYYDLLTSGRIKIAKKIEGPITVQDPCNVIRNRGLGDKLRYIMRAVCEDFVDVKDTHRYNYCCNAGGGVINCGPPWKKKRVASNKIKAEQLRETGAHTVVTPCHNCHSGIEDIIHTFKVGMEVKFYSDLLIEAMEIPEHLKPK